MMGLLGRVSVPMRCLTGMMPIPRMQDLESADG